MRRKGDCRILVCRPLLSGGRGTTPPTGSMQKNGDRAVRVILRGHLEEDLRSSEDEEDEKKPHRLCPMRVKTPDWLYKEQGEGPPWEGEDFRTAGEEQAASEQGGAGIFPQLGTSRGTFKYNARIS